MIEEAEVVPVAGPTDAPVPLEERSYAPRQCLRTRPHREHEWHRTKDAPVLGRVRVTYDCPGIDGAWGWY